MRCADVHETLSLFSNKNVYSFINTYIFAELHLYFNKNSKCLINTYWYDDMVSKIDFEKYDFGTPHETTF